MNPPACPAPAPRFEAPLAYALTALILLATACCLPLATAAKFGEHHSAYLVSGVTQLWHEGDGFLALLVAAFGLVLPVILAATLAGLLVAARGARPRPALRGWLRFAVRLGHWSMPEVQLLGIVVAFTKLSALAETHPAAGLWCYAAAGIFTLLAGKTFDPAGVAGVLFPVRPEAAR